MELSEMEKIPNFTRYKYVIDMMDPNDWARHYNEGDEVVNDFILPRGPLQKDEFSDTVYHKNASVGYHMHEKGYEFFEIARGSVECVINSVHFIAETGDLLHIPPYTAHGFIYREENTIWRELFQEIDMSGGIYEKNMVSFYYDKCKESPEFMAMYREGKTHRREVPCAWDAPLTDHNKVYNCRTPEFAWAAYDFPGCSIKLKLAKFETGGAKEVWHADAKKGLKVEYLYPHKGYELLYVKGGKLKLTIHHTLASAEGEAFIIGGDHIIDIPPYHTYTIEILEDTSIYNYGGEYSLQECLEDLASVKKNHPETVETKEDLLHFLRKYNVYATKMTYNPA